MVDIAVRMNVLKESQAESKPLLAKASFLSKRGTLMREQMLAQVFQAVHQEILFAGVVSIKRRSPHIRSVDDVLNSEIFVSLFDHQRDQGLV